MYVCRCYFTRGRGPSTDSHLINYAHDNDGHLGLTFNMNYLCIIVVPLKIPLYFSISGITVKCSSLFDSINSDSRLFEAITFGYPFY